MTCIVGISDGDTVYIGGDRGVSDGETILSMSRPKVHIKEDWIFGYSGDLGVGQFLEVIKFPIVEDTSDPYMLIVNELIYTLHEKIDDFIKDDGPQADILLGCKGRLFELNTEAWGVCEVKETAIGSGSQIALGSLYTSKQLETNPMIRITYALNAATELSTTCANPVDILYA